MQHEHEKIQFDDLAKILKSAQLRRSADLGKWLGDFIHRRHRQTPTELYRLSKRNPVAIERVG